MDYAIVHLYGRAVDNARLYNIGDDEKASRAVFDIAVNLPIRRDGKWETKAIFRRVVVWNFHADYVARCQEEDPNGLKGRPILVVGSMDTESYQNQETGERVYREVVRVGAPHGVINIIDRRVRDGD